MDDRAKYGKTHESAAEQLRRVQGVLDKLPKDKANDPHGTKSKKFLEELAREPEEEKS